MTLKDFNSLTHWGTYDYGGWISCSDKASIYDQPRVVLKDGKDITCEECLKHYDDGQRQVIDWEENHDDYFS